MFLCVHFNKVSKFIKPYSRKLIFTNYYRRQVVRNIFQGQPSCNNTSSTVRVRFAPSPTGALHVGSLRTAFYNYLLAKSSNGKFILRIEDTDDKRCIPEAAASLNKMLLWADIVPDESPYCGGSYGPYVQSQRTHLYQKYAQQLLESGVAYRCFCSPTRLELLRKDRARRKLKPAYDNRCRQLTPVETKDLLDKGTPYTIRLKVQPMESHDDLIHGRVLSSLQDEGDFILVKSDGQATYHLANVVDDHLMNISHVLRGQEWLVSTAKHLLLYKYFNWQPPVFGHLPLLTNQDGSKLSKRQDSLHVESLKKQGYTPRSLLNFLLSGCIVERELKQIYSFQEILEQFDMSRLAVKTAMLDMDRLNNFSRLDLLRQITHEKEARDTAMKLRQMVRHKYGDVSSLQLITPSFLCAVVSKCLASPIHCLQQLVEDDVDYLWQAPTLQEKDIPHIEGVDNGDLVRSAIASLSCLSADQFCKQNIGSELKRVASIHSTKLGALMKLLRVLICGGKKGAAIGDLFAVLGKTESLFRLNGALTFLATIRSTRAI